MNPEGTVITEQLVRDMAPARDDKCHKNDFGQRHGSRKGR